MPDRADQVRASSASTKHRRAPGVTSLRWLSGYGVLSKVARTAPRSLVTWPARPASRQNGWG